MIYLDQRTARETAVPAPLKHGTQCCVSAKAHTLFVGRDAE